MAPPVYPHTQQVSGLPWISGLGGPHAKRLLSPWCFFGLSQFFELEVYHSDGSPLTADQIFVQLEKIWNSSLQTNKEPVGILTSNHRNSWAKAFNTLIKGTHPDPP